MPQPLSSKENSLFRQVVKCYESKQNKKGLKAAEQILKKNPNHGETMAMKALIINSQGKHDEAMSLCKVALTHDMRSHVCWHVYGLLWRSEKNLDEASRAYKMALKIETESPQILRDLALLQIQMRDYPGYISSRRTMLTQKPNVRQNWTALAVAHHLAGNCEEAEKVLTTYESTLKSTPSKSDMEHSEAVLYKNTIIAESGKTQKALDHLEEISKNNLDRATIMERRAKYLLDLGQKSEAETAYRALIDRNPEYRLYYNGLEKALGLERSSPEDVIKLKELYASYAEKSPRGDAARWIPLGFLRGNDFRETADIYLKRMLSRGAPSTFANIKGLYSDAKKKQIIHELVLGYERNNPVEDDSSDPSKAASKKERFELSVFYFLAQHYNYHKSRDLKKAHDYIEKALEKSPKTVEYYMTQGRIWKHRGDPLKAADIMEAGRKVDERDRAINTKTAKYQLRNHQNQTALETMSKFTRNEATGGALGDLHDMQCLWFLTEDAESFLRQREIALALKRFTSVFDIFDVWQEDQYDFHTFSFKKGQIRAYVDMIRWEDRLRDHPFYTRAAVGATKALILLHDNPELAHGPMVNGASTANGMPNGDVAERKKAEKKAKREKQKREKAEADKKALEKASAANASSSDSKKEDSDPTGSKLVETSTPLEDALKFISLALTFKNSSPEVLHTGFELHYRRKKWLLALKCLLAAAEIDKEDPVLHEQIVKFKQAISSLEQPLDEQTSALIKSNLDSLLPSTSLTEWNTEFASNHSKSPTHILYAARTRILLDSESASEAEKSILSVLEISDVTMEDACRAYDYLKNRKSKEASVFQERTVKIWPHATVFGAELTESLAGLSL